MGTRDFLAAVDSYVEYCFASGTAARVDELAQRLRMHPSTLSRRFKSRTGRNLSAVLKERQIIEAQRLLTSTSMPARDVAHRAGFGTVNTLFRMFRVRLGITPEQYRRRS